MAKGLPRGIYEKVPGSKIYWIRYTDSAGKERREKCGNITAAKSRLDIRRSERHQGLQAEPTKTTLLGSLIDDAIAYAKSENDAYSARDLKYKMERIRADFGGVSATRITKSTVIEWLESETAKRLWSSASRNRYQAAWSLIFRVAIENRKLKENPAAKIKRRREDNQRTRFLSAEEEVKLTRAIEERFPRYVPVFILALHTGMRASELLRAKVGDYDETSGMFRVRQKKVRSSPTYRYVPATPIAVAAYLKLAAGKKEGAALCSKQERREDPDLRETRYWFDPCVEKASLVDFLWHDLRHTFASRLVMGGVPLAAVKDYMGHQSITMTTRYSHLSPSTHTKAVETMMGFYASETGTETGTGTLKLVKKAAKS